MLKEIRQNYEQTLKQHKQSANQGIIDTFINIRERSLYYIDESSYQ